MVNRCVCYNVLFERVLNLMKVHNWSLSRAMDETCAGNGCGMCRPYLKLVEQTGRTEFRPGEPNEKESK